MLRVGSHRKAHEPEDHSSPKHPRQPQRGQSSVIRSRSQCRCTGPTAGPSEGSSRGPAHGAAGPWRPGPGPAGHSPECEARARVKAEKDQPLAEGWDQIKRALDRARRKLGGEDVRAHDVPFHLDMWGRYTTVLPRQALDSVRISRGDGFTVAARPADAARTGRSSASGLAFAAGGADLGVGNCVGEQGVDLRSLGGGVAQAAAHHLDGHAAVETGREQCSNPAE